jgi:hypothetical protein
MVKFGLIESNNVSDLVYGTFALQANLEGVTDVRSIVHPPAAEPRVKK